MLHPRHYLDISTSDLVFGVRGSLTRDDSGRELEKLETELGTGVLVTFSVRSAWDLLLSTLALPAGSEVIMSAVTIPDMVRIVEAHGLVVIPVDLDPATMAPGIDLYSRAFSPKTRLVLLAHLLGGSFDLGPYAEIASSRDVPVVEDCAQSFEGPARWGSPNALVSFFSFGSIKTSTALGAAVAVVRDAGLADRMRAAHAGYPFQPGATFAKKAAKYLAVQGFKSPVVYGGVVHIVKRMNGGLDGFIHRTVKGFQSGSPGALLRQLRQRPSAGQAALLKRRLERFDGRRLAARRERGELLLEKLARAGTVLGSEQPNRTHWLFAIAVDDPGSFIDRLRAAGFDATQGATTIGPVSAPPDRPGFEPRVIRDVMSRAVFLPAYPEMPEREASRMIHCIVSAIV